MTPKKVTRVCGAILELLLLLLLLVLVLVVGNNNAHPYAIGWRVIIPIGSISFSRSLCRHAAGFSLTKTNRKRATFVDMQAGDAHNSI